MSTIREVCDRLTKTFLTSLVGIYRATGGLRVNLSSAYNISFVPAREECNIANDTKGGLWQEQTETNRDKQIRTETQRGLEVGGLGIYGMKKKKI